MNSLVRGLEWASPVRVPVPHPAGLAPGAQDDLAALVAVWSRRQPGNVTRTRYLMGDVRPDNLGIAVPEDMVDRIGVVSEWPAKAVDALAARCTWDAVAPVSTADEPAHEALAPILDRSRFGSELTRTVTSSLTHGVAFLIAVPGPDGPELYGRSAMWASALWDRSTRRLSAGLTVDDVDEAGMPTVMTLFEPGETVRLVRPSGVWAVEAVHRSGLDRPLMVALPYAASLDRPLGRSRLTRGVMSITQRAMRSVLRGEIAQELYTAPGMVLRGVDPDAMDALRKWSHELGSVRAISRDENGEVPEIDFTPQTSAQPMLDELRALATEFAGITSLPVGSLGIVQDNPSSAEAIVAAREDLVILAERATGDWAHPLAELYDDALHLAGAPQGRLRTVWADPARPSVVSRSDGLAKQIAAMPWLGETTVVLEKLGYTADEIARMQAERRAAVALGLAAGAR